MALKDYDIIFRMIARKYGKNAAMKVRRSALEHLAAFEVTVKAAKNETEKLHLTYIAERCAVYLALKERFPGAAYKWVDKAVKINMADKQKLLDRLTQLPGMKYVFIKMCGEVTEAAFGEKAGFRYRLRASGPKKFAFDMLECPYCRYCKKFGCEELTKSFCDSDEYVYKGLKNIEFIRTKTLGTGGDCCDFCYKIK